MTYQTEEIKKLTSVATVVERKFGKHVAVTLINTVLLMDGLCQLSASLVAHGLMSLEQMGQVQQGLNNNMRQVADVALHKMKPVDKQEVFGLIVGLANGFSDAMRKHMLEQIKEVQAAAAATTNPEVKADDAIQG